MLPTADSFCGSRDEIIFSNDTDLLENTENNHNPGQLLAELTD